MASDQPLFQIDKTKNGNVEHMFFVGMDCANVENYFFLLDTNTFNTTVEI